MKSLVMALITTAVLFITPNVKADEIKECQTDACVKYFKQFKMGSKRGYAQAHSSLGQFYYIGYGTEKNEDKALKYLNKAAKKGEQSAQYLVGVISLISKKNKDIDRAIKYLEKVAKKDYKDANFLLGTLYINDKLTPKNLTKADLYLAKAYQQKDERIPELLESIDESLTKNSDSFPKLMTAMKKKPLVKSADGFAFKKSNIEILTITSPPLTTIFDEQIISFKKRKKRTGSKLQGKTCDESIDCYQTKLNGQAMDTFFNVYYGASG